MAGDATTASRMRIGGMVFLLGGAALGWTGAHLFSGVLRWRITPDGAGLSVLWLMVTGAVLVAMGGAMLATGRCPRGLLWLLVGLLAIFVVAGVVVTLQSGGRMPRLHL